MHRLILSAAALILLVAPAQQRGRSFVSGRFGLTLGGSAVGLLHAVEGGDATADVVEEGFGPSQPAPKKHLGTVHYEPIEVQAGFDLTPEFYKDLGSFFDGHYTRKNGAIQSADFNYNVHAVREFKDALITEVGFPAFDAGDKNPGYIAIKWQPTEVKHSKASGKLEAPVGKKQKIWHPNNFRLEIAGLDCTRVSKVDGFTLKQGVMTEQVGEVRDPIRVPGKLEIPNLKITLPESFAQSWFDWFEDFVIKGNCGEDQEKSGRLVFLSQNLQDELAEIRFFNLGIFKLTTDPAQANSDAIKRVTAELYCERMEFVYQAKAGD